MASHYTFGLHLVSYFLDDTDFNYFNSYGGDRKTISSNVLEDQDSIQVGGHPCSNLKPGQDDLPALDLISKFKLDDYSHDFPGVKKVRGSNRIQTAYRLSRRADLSSPSKNLLPNGLPDQFSFVCSFRKRPSKNETWTLIMIEDSLGTPQFGLTLHPKKQSLEMVTQGVDSRLNTLHFPNVDCDDGQWNKVHLGIFVDRVTLFLNCEKHSTLPLDFNSNIDLNGLLEVAKYNDQGLGTVPVRILEPCLPLTAFSLLLDCIKYSKDFIIYCMSTPNPA